MISWFNMASAGTEWEKDLLALVINAAVEVHSSTALVLLTISTMPTTAPVHNPAPMKEWRVVPPTLLDISMIFEQMTPTAASPVEAVTLNFHLFPAISSNPH
jgi:hypothetical protein